MTTFIFLASLLLITVMIITKAYELRSGSISFILSRINKWDDLVHRLAEVSVLKFERYKKVFNVLRQEFLSLFTFDTLIRMSDFVSSKYHSTGGSFRGKRVLKSNGSVSFFLGRLSEEKVSSNQSRV